MAKKDALTRSKEGLPKEAFAIVGMQDNPDTWKLLHHKKSIGKALKGKLDIELKLKVSTVAKLGKGAQTVWVTSPSLISWPNLATCCGLPPATVCCTAPTGVQAGNRLLLISLALLLLLWPPTAPDRSMLAWMMPDFI